MMDEIVRSFAAAAGRLQQGGFDGCEVMASHCHLIDQFWSQNVNQRAALDAAMSVRLPMGNCWRGGNERERWTWVHLRA